MLKKQVTKNRIELQLNDSEIKYLKKLAKRLSPTREIKVQKAIYTIINELMDNQEATTNIIASAHETFI